MELKYLQTFKTILETGSFRAASEKLNCTQSTVTFQIQQLSHELSVQLFEKVGRKMVITQAGKDVLPYIDAILRSYDQLKSYGKSPRQMQGKLVVAMPETLLTYKMQPVLRAFREQAPQIILSLRALNCHTIRDQVINGGADIGMHYDVGGYSQTMIVEPLADFPVSLIAQAETALDYQELISGGQRSPACLITNDRESIYQGMLDNYLHRKHIVLDSIMELGSIETIKRSVASGIGIAIMPRFVIESELTEGLIQEIPVELSGQMITAVCSYHKNKYLTPAMKLFMDLSRQHLMNERYDHS